MSGAINRTKLHEDVENLITERIRSEEWGVGMKLPSEPKLAKLFDVSRATVRAAVKTLRLAGVLRAVRGSGTYVADSASLVLEARELSQLMGDPNNLYSLVETRYILEPQLASLAAKNATQEDIDELFQIVKLMEENRDRHSLITHGYLFHREVARISHNKVLYGFCQSVSSQLRGLRLLDSLTVEIFLEGIDEHRAIAKAIATRDGNLAKALMRAHLKKDYATYLGRSEILE